MCFGTVSFPSKPPPLLRQQRGSTVVHEAGFADCGKELVDLLGRSLADHRREWTVVGGMTEMTGFGAATTAAVEMTVAAAAAAALKLS